MAIRVYQIAKEYSRTTAEVMAVLKEAGIKVASHTAPLDEHALHTVRTRFGKFKLTVVDGDQEAQMADSHPEPGVTKPEKSSKRKKKRRRHLLHPGFKFVSLKSTRRKSPRRHRLLKKSRFRQLLPRLLVVPSSGVSQELASWKNAFINLRRNGSTRILLQKKSQKQPLMPRLQKKRLRLRKAIAIAMPMRSYSSAR